MTTHTNIYEMCMLSETLEEKEHQHDYSITQGGASNFTELILHLMEKTLDSLVPPDFKFKEKETD